MRYRSIIEEGYQQAERGEPIDGGQARREIQAMKEKWSKGRSSKDERLCAYASRQS